MSFQKYAAIALMPLQRKPELHYISLILHASNVVSKYAAIALMPLQRKPELHYISLILHALFITNLLCN